MQWNITIRCRNGDVIHTTAVADNILSAARLAMMRFTLQPEAVFELLVHEIPRENEGGLHEVRRPLTTP